MKVTPFADELQKDWNLVDLTISPQETVIRVCTSFRHDKPDIAGRHGSDIISYPDVFLLGDQAEFQFTKCLLVRVWDEAALSIREVNPEPLFEGRTFRRYTKSALLDLHSEFPTEGFHYQLNLPNEIIDVICKVPPIITLDKA
jgi:hypothetical protein